MQSLSRAVLACLLVLFAGISACVTTSEDSGIKDLAADTKLHPVVQTGHFSAVTSVAFSLDGQYALSGSRDHTLKLWNVLSGREIRTFKGHTDVVSSVSYTPDGRFAVSASWDKTVKMWDVATGALVRDMQGHAEKVFSVAVSRDGRYAVSASADQSAIAWRLRDGARYRVFRGHRFKFRTWARDEHSRMTATGYADRDHHGLGAYCRHKLPSALPAHLRVGPTNGHIDSVTCAVFDPAGKSVLSGSLDGSVRLWGRGSGNSKKLFSLIGKNVLSVAISPDGKQVLYGGSDALAGVLEVRSGKPVRSFKGHVGNVNAVMFSRDGRHVLTAGDDAKVRLWDIAGDEAVHTLSGHPAAVNTAVFSPDGRYLLSGDEEGNLILWETATGLQVNTLAGRAAGVNAAALLPGGRYLLSGNSDGTLKLWNTQTGRQERVYKSAFQPVTGLAIFSEGRMAVAAGRDGRISFWDIYSGRQHKGYKIDDLAVACIALSPDDRYLFLGGRDGRGRLLETSTGKPLWQFSEEQTLSAAAYSPDGRYILCGSPAKRFALRNARTGKVVKKFQGHFYGVDILAFIAGGRRIVSGGGDRALKVWDVSTGRLMKTLQGHKGRVTALAVSNDGRRLLSGGEDQVVILWDLPGGQPVRIFNGHADRLNGLCFSPDGRYLYSGSRDATVRKWHLETGIELGRMHGAVSGEWITTTPDGYYANSPEGNDLVHWVMPGRLETYSYEQFEAVFNRPEIVEDRLQGRLESGTPARDISRPPVLDMPGHRTVVNTASREYPLELALEDTQIETVRIFVNGKPEMEIARAPDETDRVLNVPLFYGANRITVIVYDKRGFSSTPQYLDVISEQAQLQKPVLHILAVGVSEYPRLPAQWQLDFAHTDARALVQASQKLSGVIYQKVNTTLLTNRDVTVENVARALSQFSQISKNDLAIIFFAGHGIRDQAGKFYFLTANGNTDIPQENSLNWDLLQRHLDRIKGRVIVLLDACHSGAVVNETVVPNNELANQFFSQGRSGVMIFSASKGRQYSLESPDIGGGYGLFTYAIIQTLGAGGREADRDRNGFIEFMELTDYVTRYVDRQSGGQQTPWISRKELFGDLPIAAVNK